MSLKKIRHYKEPEYPSREQFLSQSSDLQKYVPNAWKSKKAVMSGLAVFVMGLVPEINNNERLLLRDSYASENSNKDTMVEKKQIMNQKMDNPIIAPIFIHGDGRGALGCVVINPPVFLSEEEARQIVESELKKENIVFDKKNMRLDDVIFQHEVMYHNVDSDTAVIDGYSSELKLGYDVITGEDYRKYVDDKNYSTVQSYDLIQAADNLREKIKENGKINMVVFYDPLEHMDSQTEDDSFYKNITRKEQDSDMDENEDTQYTYHVDKTKSIELLKRQVRDFIEWVHTEGLLNKK